MYSSLAMPSHEGPWGCPCMKVHACLGSVRSTSPKR